MAIRPRAMLPALLAAILLAAAARAADLHVPADHPTIQAAVDAASPGDTIHIAAGQYNEAVKLKSGIILKGESRDAVVVAAPPEFYGAIYFEDATDIEIHDMTFTHDRPEEVDLSDVGWTGVIVARDSTALIQNCRVHAGPSNGIAATGPSCQLAIVDCLAEDNGNLGIYYHGEAKGRVERTVSRRNAQNGITVLAHDSHVDLVGNTFEENGWAGVWIEEHSQALFDNNIIRNNKSTNETEILRLVYSLDIDQLESHARLFRDTHRMTSGGTYLLANYYSYLSGVANTRASDSVAAMMKLFADWKEKYPKSAVPHVGEAVLQTSVAWAARGGGYADTVTADGWQGFHQGLQRAEQSLVNAEATGDTDPHIYAAWMKVGMGLTYARPRFDEMLEKSARIQPDYFPTYTARAYSLLPRWLGSYSDCERFASKVVEVTSDTCGEAGYARIAYSLLPYHSADELLSQFGFAYTRLQASFDDLLVQYPEANNIRNAYSRFAVAARDRETAARLFEAIGDERVPRYWRSEEDFDAARRWAAGEAELPPTQAQAQAPAPAPVVYQGPPRVAVVMIMGIFLVGVLVLLLVGAFIVITVVRMQRR